MFPRLGVIDSPPVKSMIFYKKETEKIELVYRPVAYHTGTHAIRQGIWLEVTRWKKRNSFLLYTGKYAAFVQNPEIFY